jgi:DNA-binding transcriptional LysR family regulator
VQETELFADPYVVALRKGHRLARRKTGELLDLADYDWVMPQRNVPQRAVIDSIFGQLTTSRDARLPRERRFKGKPD